MKTNLSRYIFQSWKYSLKKTNGIYNTQFLTVFIYLDAYSI